MKGVEVLKSGKDLKPGMVGFKEIAIPLSQRLKIHQTNEELRGCKIKTIKWPKSIGQEFRTSGVKNVRKLKAECEDGIPVDTTMESLIMNVEKLKLQNLKWYSHGLFLIGLACSFISFFFDQKEERA